MVSMDKPNLYQLIKKNLDVTYKIKNIYNTLKN